MQSPASVNTSAATKQNPYNVAPFDDLLGIERDGVKAHRFDLLEDIKPQARHRKPERMELSGEKEEPLASNEQRVFIPSHLCRFSIRVIS